MSRTRCLVFIGKVQAGTKQAVSWSSQGVVHTSQLRRQKNGIFTLAASDHAYLQARGHEWSHMWMKVSVDAKGSKVGDVFRPLKQQQSLLPVPPTAL
jgi:hypothetical protein